MPEKIPYITLLFILIMLIFEWFTRTKDHGLAIDAIKYRWLRILIYYILVFCILIYSYESETFIYFQF